MEKRAAEMASLGMLGPRPAGISNPSLADGGAAGELCDAEDDKLGRLHGSDPDIDDQLTDVDRVLGVVLRVAFDEERLACAGAEERAIAPDPAEERRNVALHRVPQARVVRLEHHPLSPFEDGLFDVVEKAADVEVAPLGITRDGPRAPHPDA